MLTADKIKRLEELLQQRNEEFPERTKIWYEINNECEEIFKQFTEVVGRQRDWKPDDQILHEIDRFIYKPVFICGPMRSGTTLLSNLLDNHKNLFCMPGDSHYVNRFFDFRRYEFLELALHWFKRIINPTGQAPFFYLGKDDNAYIDFLNYLKFFLIREYPTFLAVVAAVYGANPKKSMNTMYWVEKTPGNEFHYNKIRLLFPHAKFIHSIREPLANIASTKKLAMVRNRTFKAYAAAFSVKNSMKIAKRMENSEDYLTIRYEDLTGSTAEAVVDICNLLQIHYSDSLLIPTVNGELATANSMYEDSRKRGQILNLRLNQRWQKNLTNMEKMQVVSVLNNYPQYFGYTSWDEKLIQEKYSFIMAKAFNIAYRLLGKLTDSV